MFNFNKIVLGMLFIVLFARADDVYSTFTVEASRSASLAFNASGVVGKVSTDVGAIVKKGDVLATLKSDDIRASLHVTKTALKYAKRDYNRQMKVKNIINKSQLDKYTFKYENAKAQQVYQQALLDKTVLKAPFDGIITYKNLEVGDTVSGMVLRTVLKIESEHSRKLIIKFDQKYWKSVKVGLVFKYKVDGDETDYNGKISKVYPTANPKDRKMTAEIEAEDIPVGLFGTGYIVVDAK